MVLASPGLRPEIQLVDTSFCNWSNKEPYGYLNLFADLIHNIMDGIALGLVFMGADNKAMVTTTLVAVYIHELS